MSTDETTQVRWPAGVARTTTGPMAADFLWRWSCNGKACCCGGWRIGLSDSDLHRLAHVAAGTALEERVEALVATRWRGPFADFLPPQSGARKTTQMPTRADGLCIFVSDDLLCDVHREVGEAGLPQICQAFPIVATENAGVVDARFEFLCPESARALATATQPAAVLPAPERFAGRIFPGSRRMAPLTRPLVERAEVDAGVVFAFRMALAARAAAIPENPFMVLAEALAALATLDTAAPGVISAAAMAGLVIPKASVTAVYEGLVRAAVERARFITHQPGPLERAINLSRPFFVHHASGAAATLDTLDALLLAPPADIERRIASAALGPAADRVLSNFVIARVSGGLGTAGPVFDDLAVVALHVIDATVFAALFAEAGLSDAAIADRTAAAVAFAEAFNRGRDVGFSDFRLVLHALVTRAPEMRHVAPLGASAGQCSEIVRVLSHLADHAATTAATTTRAPADWRVRWRRSLVPRLAALLRGHADHIKNLLQPLSDAPSDATDMALPDDVATWRRRAIAAEQSVFNDFHGADPVAPQTLIGELVTRYGFGSADVALVGLLFFAATDEAFLRVFTHASLDYSGPGFSGSAVRALFHDDDRTVRPSITRLCDFGLAFETPATLDDRSPDDGVWQGRVPPDWRLQLHPETLAAILRDEPFPRASQAVAPLGKDLHGRVLQPAAWQSSLTPPDFLAARIQAATSFIDGAGAGVVVVCGPPGHDRPALLSAAMASSASPSALVAIEMLDHERPQRSARRPTDEGRVELEARDLLGAAVRRAVVSRARLAITWGHLARYSDPLQRRLAARLAAAARALGQAIFLVVSDFPHHFPRDLRLAEVAVPHVTAEERLRLVALHLPVDVALPPADMLAEVIASTPSPPDAMLGALRDALGPPARPGQQRTLELSALSRALRVQLAARIGDFAQLVTVKQTLADLVLPPEPRRQLAELIASVRHRKQVMEQWGFSRVDARGQAMTALFFGPPGTGKTMAAGVIARELGYEVFRVDLSRVVDKYIGETEKALGQVFSEAERGDVLLLFDEADSLFGKRSEAQTASDRYANLGVNYLLQRIETYRGPVVLTTNHEGHLDPAFKRRIRHHIDFRLPDAAERAEIWRNLLRGAVPLAAGIDYETLGYDFDFSGGHIKSAVLCACVLASMEPSTAKQVTMDHLITAANREYKALGRVVRERRNR